MSKPKSLRTSLQKVRTAAETYLSYGLRVLPVRDKVPCIGGFDDVTFTATPGDFRAGDDVAILTGPCPALGADYLLCLDLDGGLTLGDAWIALGLGLYPTPTLATHAGAHVWLRVCPGPLRDRLRQWNGLLGARARGDARDLDLKWCGGYAVERGGFDVSQIATAPDALVEALIALGAPERGGDPSTPTEDLPEPHELDDAQAEALIDAAIEEWPEVGGGRHDASKALGGAMRRAGVARDDAEAVMTALCSAVGSPEQRIVAALDAWDRTDVGEPAFARPKLRELLGDAAARTLAALDALLVPDAWSVRALATLERARAPQGPAPAAGSPTHPSVDGTGLRRCPGTGWPWILQYDGGFWFHSHNAPEYLPRRYRTAELMPAVREHLTGLIHPDDRILKVLHDEWVGVAQTLRSSYTARSNAYDAAKGEFTLAALRWLPSERAAFHEGVDRWLRALAGPEYGRLAQWLASCVALDRPAPCLYLTGPRGLGKSLLADGLAALWSLRGPATMREAISDFNESVGECPLLFSDEGFPRDLDFGAFREMVTQHSRRLNVKYGAKTTLEGCSRIVLAANNDDALRYQRIGTLTQHDLDAVADRLLVLECHEAAREAVEALDTDAVAAGQLAEHVLWLAARTELATGRMAAEPWGGARLLERVMANRSTEVLGKIREALGAGKMAEQYGVRATPAELQVNVARLHAAIVGGGGRATMCDVRELCALLAHPNKALSERHITGDGTRLRWRVLDRTRLEAMLASLD